MIENTVQTFTHLSFVFMVFIAVFASLFWYGLKTSKGHSVAFALSVVMALSVYMTLLKIPLFLEQQSSTFFVSAGIFVGIVFAIFSIVKQYIHGSFHSTWHTKLFQVSLVALITDGLLFSIGYSVFNFRSLDGVIPFEHVLFGGTYSLILWMCVLFISIFFMRGHHR